MLSKSKLARLVATAKPAEAKRFYQRVLGLSLVEDDPFALVFNANGTTLRVQKVHAVSPARHTRFSAGRSVTSTPRREA